MRIRYVIFFIALVFYPTAFCQETVILFTGTSYSSLYPSKDTDSLGGVSRRAGLIEEQRDAHKDLLLLDSGNLFAEPRPGSSGLAQAKQRTQIALKAVKDIGYDAVGIGQSEFVFGIDFLKENIRKNPVPFVSCNTDIGEIDTFVIKKSGEIKVGITGASSPGFSEYGVFVLNYETEIQAALEEFRKKGVDIIVLFSSLDSESLAALVNKFSQIDIVISSHLAQRPDSAEKIGNTIVLYPSFQSKYLGKLVIKSVVKGEVKDYWQEYIPISDDIKEDKQARSLLPACFKDADCPQKPGVERICRNPGPGSECIYKAVIPAEVKVITLKSCKPCSTGPTEELLSQNFQNLNIEKIDYQSPEGKKLIEKFNIKTLPAFLIEEPIEMQDKFKRISSFFSKSGKYFVMDKKLSGIFYYLNRPYKAGRIDLFVRPFDKEADSVKAIAQLKSITQAAGSGLTIHFIADSGKNKYYKEEILRLIAVRELYPDKFIDYFESRLNNFDSSFWDLSAKGSGIDVQKITEFTFSGAAEKRLRQDMGMAEELGVVNTPALLIDNRKIFSFTGSGRLPEKILEEF